MKHILKYFYMILATSCIALFQNCGQSATDFSDPNFKAAVQPNGSIGPSSTPGGTLGSSDVNPPAPAPAPTPAPTAGNNPSPTVPPTFVPGTDDDGHVCHHDGDDNDQGQDVDNDNDKDHGDQDADNDDDKSSSSLNYICVLQGPGDSVKLAFLADKKILQGQNSASADIVCTTKAGCDVVNNSNTSLKGQVKEADYRGYCKNKKNIQPLTADQLSAILNPPAPVASN